MSNASSSSIVQRRPWLGRSSVTLVRLVERLQAPFSFRSYLGEAPSRQRRQRARLPEVLTDPAAIATAAIAYVTPKTSGHRAYRDGGVSVLSHQGCFSFFAALSPAAMASRSHMYA